MHTSITSVIHTPEAAVVIAFQSIVALCAFAGLGGLLQYVRREASIPVRTAGRRDDDGVRLGLVLRSNGQASGPN